MHSSSLARVRELLASAGDAASRTSFARSLDAAIEADPHTFDVLRDYDTDLASLDAANWAFMKDEACQRLARVERRNWSQVFDVLNEAKAYRYLQTLGCHDITFLSPSYAQKSPDIIASLNGQRVVCEVKTVVISDTVRIPQRGRLPGRRVSRSIEDFLTGKLTRVIKEAKAQLDTYADDTPRKIVCIGFHPDSGLREAVDIYWVRIKEFIERAPTPGIEVSVFLHPDFYSAAP